VTAIIVIALIAIGVIVVLSVYNKLVASRNLYKNAFAQIDVQLKRRYDLIPNLVETAKGYLSHEKTTLESVIAARNSAASAANVAARNPGDGSAIKALNEAEGALGGALSKLMLTVEAYPDLKGNTLIMEVSEELSVTENRISAARAFFNDQVTAYNTAREVFPAVLFANAFGFTEASLFEINNTAEREVPKVSFS
jgi:LemA protein